MPETLDCCNLLRIEPSIGRFPFSKLLLHDNPRGAACDEITGREMESESIDKNAIYFLIT